ncbi:hypothetical protein ACW73L_05590 [Methylolobus aquaticus]
MDTRSSTLRNLLSLAALCGLIAVSTEGLADATRTLGVIKRDTRAYEGYNLYKPLGGTEIYLLNNAGNPVHQWTIPDDLLPKPEGVRPGGEVFLRKNGELVLTADWGIAALDKDSNIAWKIDSRTLGPDRWYGHHEVVELPNGNLLLPGYIEKTRAEAETAGFPVALTDACPRPPAPILEKLRVDNLWEVAPINRKIGFKSGWKVVWRWNTWDHMYNSATQEPNRHRADIAYVDPAEGVCGNFIQGAWTFGRYNAIAFNAERNEIALSASLQNEVRIISHALTTDQARTTAGDFLYRWGNPYAYNAGQPFVSSSDRGDQQLSFQHRVLWIPKGFPGAGNLLIFNNGTDWGESSVIEVKTPIGAFGSYRQPFPGLAYGPRKPIWQYAEPVQGEPPRPPFVAPFISSAQRLANGNTLINNGPYGYFFEITHKGEKVWEYLDVNSGASQGDVVTTPRGAYRLWRYSPDYEGLLHIPLAPKEPLEFYPNEYAVDAVPGSCTNSIRVPQDLAIAILGSPALNVATIDPASILIEGIPAASWTIKDVSASGKCYQGDGYPDLVLSVKSSSIFPSGGKPNPGQMPLIGKRTVRLNGYSGQGWFAAKDDVFVLR